MNDRNQIVITRIQDKPILIYMEQEKIYDVLVGDDLAMDAISVGNIYLGRVQNIVQNINAAFVEVAKDQICFLPLSECMEFPLKCGDCVVVQVKKAAIKTKQAVVSLLPEIAGRYCVVTAKNRTKNISKKITDSETRVRFMQILDDYQEEPFGIVLRTNAEFVSDEEIRSEIDSILQELHFLMEKEKFHMGLSLLRKEAAFYHKYIQSCQLSDISRIITDDENIYRDLYALYGEKSQWYQDDSYSLDKLLGIHTKLDKAFEKRAWLKSGGNLVIEPTEALTVIDVNTGKAIDGKRNKETTFFKINCEAAKEAARQMRMRNLSGIILIDFIDMQKRSHQEKLMMLLREELKKDKTRTALVDITKLGLVEITRMKKNKPLWEVLSKNA